MAMKLYQVVIVTTQFLMTGCCMSRNICFSDGSVIEATVYGSHQIFTPKPNIVLRDLQTGKTIGVDAHVCTEDMVLDTIFEESKRCKSSLEYITLIAQEGWEWY